MTAGAPARTPLGGPGGDEPETTGLSVRAHGLVFIYRLERTEVVALSSIDLEVAPGERVALLGPSGAGKSTLLRLLAGLQSPSAGRLWVGDHDLAAASSAELDRLRAADIGVLLQGAVGNLLPYLDAVGNVRFAQRAAQRYRRESLPRPQDLLSLVDLPADDHRRPAALSVGEAQRLALAVAVAGSPGLLLADEPTSQLETHRRDEIIDALEAVNRELGTTVVTVTHDLDVAARFPRTVTIRDGRVGSEGRTGSEFAVVGRDGAVQLPPAVRALAPAGTLLRVSVDEAGRLVLEPDGEPQ